jgi:hypothetical protein
VKRNDDGSDWQVQKSVYERASVSLSAQKDEELRPGLRLEDVREAHHPEQNDGQDFDRFFHAFLPWIRRCGPRDGVYPQ